MKTLELEISKVLTECDGYHKYVYGEAFYRGIWYKVQDGKRIAVDHIIEGTASDICKLADLQGEVSFSDKHEGVNFGRAKKMTSKAKKVIESL